MKVPDRLPDDDLSCILFLVLTHVSNKFINVQQQRDVYVLLRIVFPLAGAKQEPSFQGRLPQMVFAAVLSASKRWVMADTEAVHVTVDLELLLPGNAVGVRVILTYGHVVQQYWFTCLPKNDFIEGINERT